MTNVKMIATDTLHISSVSADHLIAGQPFEVSGQIADDLEARGLASRVPEPAAPGIKEAEAPENKMETPVENKAAAKPAPKRRG